MAATQMEWSNDSGSNGGGFAGALLLHAAIAGAIITWTLLGHSTSHWGSNSETAGAIQASMVSSIPLATQQTFDANAHLASENSSEAPVTNTKATVEAPKPNEELIQDKKKIAKVADKTAPAVKYVAPTPVPVNKAVTGDTGGVNLHQSVIPLKNGTATASVQDQTFGARYAWYVEIINRKVAQNWFAAEADPHSSTGKRVTIVFDVQRDGTPTNPRIQTRSGSPTLDNSALQAVQRTDGFGPLPAGNSLTVEYSFDYHQQ